MKKVIMIVIVAMIASTVNARPNVGFVCQLKGHNCKYSQNYVPTNTVPIIHQAAFRWCQCKEWQEKWQKSLSYADTYCMYCGNRFDKTGKAVKTEQIKVEPVREVNIRNEGMDQAAKDVMTYVKYMKLASEHFLMVSKNLDSNEMLLAEKDMRTAIGYLKNNAMLNRNPKIIECISFIETGAGAVMLARKCFDAGYVDSASSYITGATVMMKAGVRCMNESVEYVPAMIQSK